MSGLVRAPVADFKTFNKSASLCAWNSSNTAHDTDNPSADFASDDNGSAVECVDLTVRLFRRTVTRLLSAGDAFTIRVASSWAILA
jgi:hypothetical protein